MATGRHIVNRFLGVSQRFIVRLTLNLARRSKITLDTGHSTKMPKFDNSRYRQPPFWKWFNRYISADYHPFSMMFGMRTEILVLKSKLLCNTSPECQC